MEERNKTMLTKGKNEPNQRLCHKSEAPQRRRRAVRLVVFGALALLCAKMAVYENQRFQWACNGANSASAYHDIPAWDTAASLGFVR